MLPQIENMNLYDDDDDEYEHFVATADGAFIKCKEKDAWFTAKSFLENYVCKTKINMIKKSICKHKPFSTVRTRSQTRPRKRIQTTRWGFDA